ncbi:MAG: energy transducer TonB [bacterium]
MDSQRYKTITASVILHLLFFLLWLAAIELDLFADSDSQNRVDNKPLVFELQNDLPKQVIETPEDAKLTEKPENPQFASDKNALARNSETDPAADNGAPFARGDFEFPELPKPQGPVGEPVNATETNPQEQEASTSERKTEEENADEIVDTRKSNFSREFLTRPQRKRRAGVTENVPTVRYDNRNSKTPDMGGLSFNTYDWDFAPYMLVLKKKIQRNIFPPAAFTRLGMIKGETLLRFRIYPNGELRDLVLLEYNGHRTLMETSMSAVRISAPFPELPDDFPEDYLEVTGKFFYFLRGR